MAPKTKRKAKPAKTQNQKQPQKSKSFLSYFSVAFVVVFLLPFLLSYLIFSQKIQPEHLQSFNAQHQLMLKTFEKQLELHLQSLQRELEALTHLNQVQDEITSSSDPVLVKINSAKDLAISQLVVFPKGNHRPNTDMDPAISFIMINNAYNASRTGETTLEVENDLLYITAQVTSPEGTVLGAATATIPKSKTFDHLQDIIRNQVAIQIIQVIDSSENVVHQFAGWNEGKEITHNDRFNDIFRIKAQWLGTANRSFFNELLLLAMSFAIGIAGVFVLAVVCGLYNRSQTNDLEVVRDAMIDLFRGKTPSKEKFQLKQIAETYENIYDNLKNTATITGGSAQQQGSDLMSDNLFGSPSSPSPEPPPANRQTYSRERYAMEITEQPTPAPQAAVNKTSAANPEATEAPKKLAVPQGIFRAYDIRGIYPQEMSEDVVEAIGRAIGSAAIAAGTREVTVARDGRTSGPSLIKALRKGLKKTGVVVIDVGMVPTPLLYFAAKKLTQGTGVMLTGSHNPPDYNGLKIMIAGETLYGDTIQALYNRIITHDLAKGTGQILEKDIMEDYQSELIGDIVLSRALKVVVDCGNGVTGVMMPELFEQLGVQASGLYTEVDGTFPNHAPDPSQPKNMQDLISAVKLEGADLGLAFDGDGDRVGIITPSGKMVYADKIMMLFAENVLASNPGQDIIYDVKCSSDLTQVIRNAGGRPVMWKTGHSLIKAKLRETNAPLAGEMSGHIFFNDRWNGFDDAIYAAARLLEILSSTTEDLDQLLERYPQKISTPEIHIEVTEESKFDIITALIKQGQFGNGTSNEIDGLRVDFEKGWGLLRASNTTPVLVARFEAETEEVIQMIQGIFRKNLQAVAPNITIPF